MPDGRHLTDDQMAAVGHELHIFGLLPTTQYLSLRHALAVTNYLRALNAASQQECCYQ
jgi:hypothetical protein